MKTKNSEAPRQSKWGALILSTSVLLSCFAMCWYGLINVYSVTAHFDEFRLSWDSRQEKIFFARSSQLGFYSLSRSGRLTCEAQHNYSEVPMSVSKEQLAVFADHYGPIESYDQIDDDVVALILPDSFQFMGLPESFIHSSRLVILFNGGIDSAVSADAQDLYQADLRCGNGYTPIVTALGLFAVCAFLSVRGILRLRSRFVWLVIFGGMLFGSIMLGYALGLMYAAMSDF